VPLGGGGRFSVDLPASLAPLRLAGFLVTARGTPQREVQWQLTGLATESGPLPLAGDWRSVGRSTVPGDVEVRGTVLRSTVTIGQNGETPFAVVQPAGEGPVPVLATPQALTALHLKVGAPSPLRLAGTDISVKVVGTVSAMPGTEEPAAILADLPSLTNSLLSAEGLVRSPQEWWIATTGADTSETVAAAGRLPGLRALDRRAAAATFAGGAYGEGARIALFAAALGAILLAAAGITVDVRTTARRRITELAVLHTLGAGTRLLARSIMVEQAFLAGMGVLVGLVVGLGVAATMAPLLILTPTAGRPVPPPLLEFDRSLVAGTALLLLALALGLSALVGTTLRRRLAVAQLRIGADR
jgi:predicted lysophospholipase L1 biosynthesis ABC-type transport system permease subunit